jgi:hypothetical protein
LFSFAFVLVLYKDRKLLEDEDIGLQVNMDKELMFDTWLKFYWQF